MSFLSVKVTRSPSLQFVKYLELSMWHTKALERSKLFDCPFSIRPLSSYGDSYALRKVFLLVVWDLANVLETRYKGPAGAHLSRYFRAQGGAAGNLMFTCSKSSAYVVCPRV